MLARQCLVVVMSIFGGGGPFHLGATLVVPLNLTQTGLFNMHMRGALCAGGIMLGFYRIGVFLYGIYLEFISEFCGFFRLQFRHG